MVVTSNSVLLDDLCSIVVDCSDWLDCPRESYMLNVTILNVRRK